MALMSAPESGAKIRMYRQGHGDCFLLAFPRKGGGDRPVFVLIDCGYKPGSQIKRNNKKIDANRVVKDIAEATGKKIDIVVVTHEHQDHVNALGKFKDFEFEEAWFAWTENPDDDDANALRERHKDQLLGLLGARKILNAAQGAAAKETVERLDELLALELGNEIEDDDDNEADRIVVDSFDVDGAFAARRSDPLRSMNKKAMKVVKDRAKKQRFIEPHAEVLSPDQIDGIRIYPLGPPKDPDLLRDEDPVGEEEFHLSGRQGSSVSFFAAAGSMAARPSRGMPFDQSFSISKDRALQSDDFKNFFDEHYGMAFDDAPEQTEEVTQNASWRRIDEEWLFASEAFALKLNRGINNTSLVLAFELEQSGKVLLFAADAQRGNWKSWDDGSFDLDGKQVRAKDLLSRTVVYKTGHHGSHNATLKGTKDSDYPSLGWMAQGKFASQFTVFITAHRKWALEKAKWNHPLPVIKDELYKKSAGRLFQTDEDEPTRPSGVPTDEWDQFISDKDVVCKDLYFEISVKDEPL